MNEKSSVERWSAKRMQDVVLHLLGGESLDALSPSVRIDVAPRMWGSKRP